jgi:tripartite-type tricarboxylate transporter receptor subunit TctC
MSTTRRLTLLAAAVACLAPSAFAQGDAWPAKQPIRIVVPFAPGGTSDILARTLGEKLQAALKQTVVIENKAGAGGVIGADAVAKAAPDGYTLLLGTIATHAINPAAKPNMPYDAGKDFAPVWLIGSISNVLLVGANQPYKSAQDVINAAKAEPGKLVFGSAGQGTSQHMSGETLRLLAGIDITHVPYKGSGPATQDLIAGQIPMTIDTALVALPHIQAGKIRALAVTSARRTGVLPDVPTLAEAGVPGFDVSSWQALFAPAGTPAAIVQRLNTELANIAAQPDIKARLAGLGVDHSANTPAQFSDYLASERAKWVKIVKDGKIQL